MEKPYNMSFAKFADMVKPSGAVNRFPSIGAGMDVFSYSVYLNGPLAEELPADIQEHQFKDVMVHALTDKLGLNSESFRDNLKVAEMVTTRNAWMMVVLDASLDQSISLSEEVKNDYALLTNGMTHPWILDKLTQQKQLSFGLQPVLDSAGFVVGAIVKDRAPGEITTGAVVSQNNDFTVQATVDGEVVTHENRRLGAVPVVGQNITVAYYRGGGQVFESRENLLVTPPFIDEKSGDLAVGLIDELGRAKQIVLFSGVASFAKFVEAQGLDKSLVVKAIEVREAQPKPVVEKVIPKRELISDVYIDDKSGCLAVDYKEKGGEYSVLFENSSAMIAYANDFGLSSANLSWGKALESESRQVTVKDADKSVQDLSVKLRHQGMDMLPMEKNRAYFGKIVAESSLHVAQDIGRGVVVVHDKRELDKVAIEGDRLTVKYENDGRGRVTDMVKNQGKDIGR